MKAGSWQTEQGTTLRQVGLAGLSWLWPSGALHPEHLRLLPFPCGKREELCHSRSPPGITPDWRSVPGLERMSNSGTTCGTGVHCPCSSSRLVNRACRFLLSVSSIGLMHINKLHLSSISEEALMVISACRICFKASLHFASARCTGIWLLLYLGRGKLLSV